MAPDGIKISPRSDYQIVATELMACSVAISGPEQLGTEAACSHERLLPASIKSSIITCQKRTRVKKSRQAART